MEGLKELVAASFARHGIVCPEGDSRLAQPTMGQPVLDPPILHQPSRAAEPVLTSSLPEHNFRKSLQGDPAP
jgi:hypothetical protein